METADEKNISTIVSTLLRKNLISAIFVLKRLRTKNHPEIRRKTISVIAAIGDFRYDLNSLEKIGITCPIFLLHSILQKP